MGGRAATVIINGIMTSRHKRQWRPTLRPDRERYQSVQAKLHSEGSSMNERFDQWLDYMDGVTDVPPARPKSGKGETVDPRAE